jgi:hypothetical protein
MVLKRRALAPLASTSTIRSSGRVEIEILAELGVEIFSSQLAGGAPHRRLRLHFQIGTARAALALPANAENAIITPAEPVFTRSPSA